MANRDDEKTSEFRTPPRVSHTREMKMITADSREATTIFRGVRERLKALGERLKGKNPGKGEKDAK